jgi:CheY-like chemotaxis protein
MSGLDVLRALQADPRTARVPCVALSADAMPQQIETAMAAGCVAYLTKPLELRRLLSLVDAVARGELATAAADST